MIKGNKRKPPSADDGEMPDSLTVDGDWFRQRAKELGLTQREIAAFIRRDPALLSRSLSGDRDFDAKDVVGLAKILKVPTEEILARMGLPVPKVGTPVVGKVMDDGRVSSITSRKGAMIDHITCPPGAEALVVEAERGGLSTYNGAAVIFMPSGGTVPADAFGRLCVVEAEGEIVPLLGSLGKASERGKVKLTVFGTAEEKLLSKVHSASVVLKIVLA